MAGKYVLNTTLRAEVSIELGDAGQAVLCQKAFFSLGADDINMLVPFLQAVKADQDNTRHTYTGPDYEFEYEPRYSNLTFVITHRATGRQIGMEWLTAWKLLDALTGNTAHLVREDGQKDEPL